MQTQNAITYRRATASDTPAIAQLHTNSWLQNYRGMFSDAFLDTDLFANRIAVWTKRFEDNPENQYIIVAEDSTGLCGFACFYLNENAMYGTLLDNLHVAKNKQGSKIGVTLMQKMAAFVHEKLPNSPFYLWVLEPNHQARRFYEQLGATNLETVQGEDPIGCPLWQCRYVWGDVGTFLQ